MEMDRLRDEVRQQFPCTIIFMDDGREQVEEKLERWRYALQRRGLKVSRGKDVFKLKGSQQNVTEVKKVQEFKSLESTVQKKGKYGKKVTRRLLRIMQKTVRWEPEICSDDP